MKNDQLPTEETKDEYGSKSVTRRHPAYAVVSLVRGQSTGTRLFGSDLVHHHTLSLTVHTAKEVRQHGSEHRFAQESLIEVEMSEAQFARLVASVGIGSGVPCTLRRTLTGGYVEVPGIAKSMTSKAMESTQDMEKALAKALSDIQGKLEALSALAEGQGVPSKRALREGLKDALRVVEHLPGNLGFAHKQFHESVERTVEEGKTEIESFVQHVAMAAGLPNLAEQLRLTSSATKEGGSHVDA